MIPQLKELLHRLETEDRPTVTCEHVDALIWAIKKLQGPPIREMVEFLPKITLGEPHLGIEPNPHSFPEDFGDENGKYRNSCRNCGHIFYGHKRREFCKVCETALNVRFDTYLDTPGEALP